MMVAETVSEASEFYSISTQLVTREYFIADLELHLFLNKNDSLKFVLSSVSILSKYLVCLLPWFCSEVTDTCNETVLYFIWFDCILLKKSKAIPVTGHGGPYGCEISRLPHFLDNRLRDGGELGCQPYTPATLYTQKDSWY
jgi:hypothetical protein